MGEQGPAPQDRVIATYRRHADLWAGRRGDRLPEQAWIERFCMAVPVGGSIADIGCGPGRPIAARLVQKRFHVTGIDAAPEMLDLFQRHVPAMPTVLADMREMDLGRRFDGLIAWDSFFHLTPGDQRAMFPRFADHANRGAPLMFTSGPEEGCAIGELGGDPLYHGSLGPAEYRDRLAASGFEVLDHVAEEPATRRTIWLARKV